LHLQVLMSPILVFYTTTSHDCQPHCKNFSFNDVSPTDEDRYDVTGLSVPPHIFHPPHQILKIMKFLHQITLSLAFFIACSFGASGQNIYGTLSEDQITRNPLSSSDQNAVILIHGWNPDGVANPFLGDDWAKLSNALRARLVGSNWKLLQYNWAEGANTGNVDFTVLGALGFTNATAAAANGFANGTHLADGLQSNAPNLRKVLFIAHSAGSWVARRAVDKLLEANPTVTVQMVLLDPFVPGVDPSSNTFLTTAYMSQLTDHTSVSRILRMENYYAVDVLTDTDFDWGQGGGRRATSQTFEWRTQDVNRRVDYISLSIPPIRYGGHGGPIQFYADSVLASAGTPSDAFSEAPYPATNYGYFLALPAADSTGGALRVSLIASRDPVSDGGNLMYTATVVNTSATPMTDVSLNISLPWGIEIVHISDCLPAAYHDAYPGDVLKWRLGSLNAGASWSAQFHVTTNSSSVADGMILSFNALATDTNGQQATATLDTRVATGLRLQLRSEAREVKAGDTVRFVATYSNPLSSSESSELSLELPPGFVITTSTGGAIQNGTMVRWDLGIVAAGSGGNVEVVAIAPTPVEREGVFAVRSVLSSQFGDEATATVSVIVRPENPLRVSLIASRDPVSDGGNLIYTATVVNTSATPMTDVNLNISLPWGIDIVRASNCLPAAYHDAYPGDVLKWRLGSLNAGASWSAQFLVTTISSSVADGMILSFNALATATNGQQATATLDTRVATGLRLQLRSEAREVKAGDTVRFAATYSNSLSSAVDGSVVDIELPPGFAITSATEGATQSENVVSWNLGFLPAGAGGRVEVVATAPTTIGTADVFQMRGAFSAQFMDPAIASESLVVRRDTQLRVTLTSTQNVVGIGGSLIYTVTAYNTGTTLMSGVKLYVLLPRGINTVYGNQMVPPNSNSWSGGEVVKWTVGGLSVGASSMAQFTVTPNSSFVANGALLRFGALAFNDAGQQANTNKDVMVGMTFRQDLLGVPTIASRIIAFNGDLAFGSVVVSQNAPRTLTIRNTGNRALTVSGIQYPTGYAGNWTRGVIAPNGEQAVTVTFMPSSIQSYSGVITVLSDATGGSGVMNVSGSGAAPTRIVSLTGNLSFGDQTIATISAIRMLRITNSGNSLLSVNNIIYPSGFSGNWSGGTIAAGAWLDVAVTFSPITVVGYDGTISLTSDQTDGVSTFPLSGNGIPAPKPEIVVEQPVGIDLPSSGARDFGAVNVGANQGLSFTIRNTGNADLTGLVVTLGGINASDFMVSALVSSTLISGASANFTVAFAPTAAGFRSAVIQIASNDADENPFDVALSGTGVAVPEIAVEEPVGMNLIDGAAAMAFGNSNIGAPIIKTVTVRNTGTANLVDIAVSRGGMNASDFSLSALGATTLAPGAITHFTVTFTPTAAGFLNAVIQVASNDSDENPFDIVLSGTGVAVPEIVVEEPEGTNLVDGAAVLAFGNSNVGTPVIKTVTVRNSGTADLTGLAMSRSGPNASDMSVSALGSTTLAPGAITTFTVAFTPTAAGSRSAVLQISSNDANENPFDIALSGTGVALDPYDLAFVGTPYELRVGNQVTFDLNRLRNPGETLKVSGKIPTGLKFNTLTGQLTGILAGKAGTYQVSVQVLQGRSVIRTITLSITVLDFPSSLIGNFDFLMEDSNSVPIGVCKITITRANQWSATLQSAGSSKKRSAKGIFTLAEGSPVAQITAPFPADTGATAVTVNISLNGSTPGITGTYNGGTLRGFRIAKVGELPPATVAYSLVLDASEQSGINLPAGLGWMKGNVSNQGIGAFKGLLGDGTAASITLRVSAFGQAILWSQPYKIKSSYIGGIITLKNLGQPAVGQAPFEDEVWWTKTADAGTLSYPSGFPGMTVTVGTSRWTAPASAAAMGSSLGWRDNSKTSIVINGAGLSNQDPQSTTAKLPTEFTLDSKFALVTSLPVGATPVAWKGKASKTDGAISGAFTIPAGFSSDVLGGSAAVSGVLLQDELWGATTCCGQIRVPVAGPKGSFKTAAIVLGQ